MSYLPKTFNGPPKKTYWDPRNVFHLAATQTDYYYIRNRGDEAIGGLDSFAETGLGYSARFFIVQLAQREMSDDVNCMGTFGMLTQVWGGQRWVRLMSNPSNPNTSSSSAAAVVDETAEVEGESAPGTGGKGTSVLTSTNTTSSGGVPSMDTLFQLELVTTDYNRKPGNAAMTHFKIYINNTTSPTTYRFRRIGDGATVRSSYLNAVSGDVGVPFVEIDTYPTIEPFITNFELECDVSSGPVLGTTVNATTGAVLTGGFTYWVSSAYQENPLPGYDFNWQQLTTSTSGSTLTYVLQTGFSSPSTQSWYFIPVKSKLNSDAINSYKIRVQGSATGFLSCTARGIVGDEFELQPHVGIFGCFTIRSVAHSTFLKVFLTASPSSTATGFATTTTTNPQGAAYAWQFRPASSPFV